MDQSRQKRRDSVHLPTGSKRLYHAFHRLMTVSIQTATTRNAQEMGASRDTFPVSRGPYRLACRFLRPTRDTKNTSLTKFLSGTPPCPCVSASCLRIGLCLVAGQNHSCLAMVKGGLRLFSRADVLGLVAEEETRRDKRAFVWISVLEILAAGTLLLTTVHVVCLPQLSSFPSDGVPSRTFLENANSPDRFSFLSLVSSVSDDSELPPADNDGKDRVPMIPGGGLTGPTSNMQHAVGRQFSLARLLDVLGFGGNRNLQEQRTGVHHEENKLAADESGGQGTDVSDFSALMRGLFYWHRRRFKEQQRAAGLPSFISRRRVGPTTMLVPSDGLREGEAGRPARRRSRTATRESKDPHAAGTPILGPSAGTRLDVGSFIEAAAESKTKEQSAATSKIFSKQTLSGLSEGTKDAHSSSGALAFLHAPPAKVHLEKAGRGGPEPSQQPYSFIEDRAQPADGPEEEQEGASSTATMVSRRDAVRSWLVVLKFTVFIGAVSCVIFAIAGTILVRANRKLKSGATGYAACEKTENCSLSAWFPLCR